MEKSSILFNQSTEQKKTLNLDQDLEVHPTDLETCLKVLNTLGKDGSLEREEI